MLSIANIGLKVQTIVLCGVNNTFDHLVCVTGQERKCFINSLSHSFFDIINNGFKPEKSNFLKNLLVNFRLTTVIDLHQM